MIDNAQMLDAAATELLQARQPLAAAILFGEAVKLEPESAGSWCKLGVAVGRSVGMLVTIPFWTWSARCLRRSLALEQTGELAGVCREWLATLKETVAAEIHRWPDPAEALDVDRVEPATPGEVDELLGFLDVNASVITDGLRGLADPLGAIMAIGDHGGARFAPAIAAAIRGELGPGAQRGALKRVGRFRDQLDVRAAVSDLAKRGDAEEAGPYLTMALRTLGL